MPTYEYACKSCGEHIEIVQSFRDEALTECPNCGGQLRKVFSPVGISFKGSGFYRNDSRSAAKTGARGDKHDTKAPEKSEASASGTESKAKESGDGAGTKAKKDAKSEAKSA
jgi:putative FmdB family regulatory protein